MDEDDLFSDDGAEDLETFISRLPKGGGPSYLRKVLEVSPLHLSEEDLWGIAHRAKGDGVLLLDVPERVDAIPVGTPERLAGIMRFAIYTHCRGILVDPSIPVMDWLPLA